MKIKRCERVKNRVRRLKLIENARTNVSYEKMTKKFIFIFIVIVSFFLFKRKFDEIFLIFESRRDTHFKSCKNERIRNIENVSCIWTKKSSNVLSKFVRERDEKNLLIKRSLIFNQFNWYKTNNNVCYHFVFRDQIYSCKIDRKINVNEFLIICCSRDEISIKKNQR